MGTKDQTSGNQGTVNGQASELDDGFSRTDSGCAYCPQCQGVGFYQGGRFCDWVCVVCKFIWNEAGKPRVAQRPVGERMGQKKIPRPTKVQGDGQKDANLPGAQTGFPFG